MVSTGISCKHRLVPDIPLKRAFQSRKIKAIMEFKPDSYRNLCVRYRDACTRLFANADDPLSLRAHVFDFKNGLRIVVHREEDGLHFRFYVLPGTQFGIALAVVFAQQNSMEAERRLINAGLKAILRLSGDKSGLNRIEDATPHFVSARRF